MTTAECRMSTMLKNVPLAPNPKSAMLITMNDRWFQCPMENTRVSKTSKARVEKDTRKMAVKGIVGIERGGFFPNGRKR